MARILLVDDDKDVGITYELILESHGFDVDCFTDPAMALEQFKPNLYDLTILDIKMPDPNGFKLYDQLKSKDSKIKTLFIQQYIGTIHCWWLYCSAEYAY